MITIGVHGWAAHVHPGQSAGDRLDAGLLKHFAHSTVRGILARFDDAGNRGPGVVVGALHQKHLLIANDHSGHPRHPQWCMTDVPTKFNDEFGDRHTQCLTDTSNRGQRTAGDVLGIGE
jgi:hypothetical protein